MPAMIATLNAMTRTASVGAEIGDDDLNEDERGDEEIDVQLDQRADIEAAAAIEQPADAEHDEDRQEDLGEDVPEEHADFPNRPDAATKTKSARETLALFANQPGKCLVALRLGRREAASVADRREAETRREDKATGPDRRRWARDSSSDR